MTRGTKVFASLAAMTMLGALGAVGWTASTSSSPDPWKETARYRFEYRVGLGKIAAEGTRVRLWVPYPADGPAQKVLESAIESPWPWKLHREPKFGNRMIYTEGLVGAKSEPFILRVTVERSPFEGLALGERAPEGVLSPALYRTPDRLVPLSGLIEQIAAQESEGLSSPQQKIRAFYDYVYRTMTYNKDGDGWGRGDAVWACTNKRGNCTDFHSLFIGMLRSQGISARFLIGFPIPDAAEGEIPGYHCWAEFFDPAKGWMPVDASEAKKKGLQDAYFGALPNDRIEFTLGRDLVLAPKQEGEPLNYFIYPYAEVSGKPVEVTDRTMRFERLAPGVTS